MQIAAITRTVCMKFLDPYTKSLLFANFWPDMSCVGTNRGPDRYFPLFNVCKERKLRTSLTFGQYGPCICQVGIKLITCVSIIQFSNVQVHVKLGGHFRFDDHSKFEMKVRRSSENDRQVSETKPELVTPA